MNYSEENKKTLSVAHKLLKDLNEAGLNAGIDAISANGSVYIRFGDSRLGTIRISNHPPRGWPYKAYKYHVRTDLRPGKERQYRNKKNISRFVVGIEKTEVLLRIVKKKFKKINSKFR